MIAESLLDAVAAYGDEKRTDPATVEAATSGLRLLSVPPRSGMWMELGDGVERFAQTLPPPSWPEVLVELEPDANPARWLDSARPSRLPPSDDTELLRRNFLLAGGSSPGLSLGTFGLVSLWVPPSRELLEWLHSAPGVANLWFGGELCSIPEPLGEPAADGPWDGHDLVMGRGASGYPSWFDYAKAGKGILLAVLDTGISAQHVAFKGKIEAQVDFTGHGVGDRHGHGSHCAGIAAGARYFGDKLHGVATAARLLDVKVLGDDGSGATSGVIRGVVWAVQKGARVISMSLGSRGRTDGRSILTKALQQAAEKDGVFVAVAAGNSGPSPRTIGTPGDARDACTVAAVDSARRVTSFSSRGPTDDEKATGKKPDLCAPGHGVAGPAAPGSRLYRGSEKDRYVLLSGTSMATPFAAGSAAVMLAATGKIAPVELKKLFAATTAPPEGEPGEYAAGAGILSLDKAMRKRGSGGALPPAKPALVAATVVLGVVAVLAASLLLSNRAQRQSPAETRTEQATSPPAPAAGGDPADAGAGPVVVDLGELEPEAGPTAIADQRGEVTSEPAGTQSEPEPWQERAGHYRYDPVTRTLTLKVLPRATVTELAGHFRLSQQEILDANPSVRARGLVAGQEVVIPVGHLRALPHRVRPGDTVGDLSWVFQAPNRYSLRAWNAVGSDILPVGTTLIAFVPPDSPVRRRPPRPPDRRREGAWELWQEERLASIRATNQMNLSDLAVHMRLPLDDTSRACRRRGSGLQAGDECLFGLDHVKVVVHTVAEGETLALLGTQYAVPSPYSIRAWNGLPSSTIRVGDELLILTSPTE